MAVAKPAKGLYGDKDFNLWDEVRVSYTGQIIAFDSHDSCMQVRTGTGLVHYVFDGDPSAIILPVKASWPPRLNDVWLINNKVWHTDRNGGLVIPERADGKYGLARKAENILHSADTPPEMLFRWSV